MVSNLCLSQNHKYFLLYFLLEVLWAILSAKNGLKLFFTSGCLIASISFAKLAVFYLLYCLCTRSVAQSCLTICDPMNCSTPGFPVLHHLPEFTQLKSIKSVMPSSHLMLCCPLLLLPPIFPSIRVFPMSQLFTLGAQSIVEFQLQH